MPNQRFLYGEISVGEIAVGFLCMTYVNGGFTLFGVSFTIKIPPPNWAYMIDCFFLFQYLRQIYSDDCQVFDAFYHDDSESW